jgi:hypothetical protein
VVRENRAIPAGDRVGEVRGSYPALGDAKPLAGACDTQARRQISARQCTGFLHHKSARYSAFSIWCVIFTDRVKTSADGFPRCVRLDRIRKSHITGHDRSQTLLLPESVDDYFGPENPVRFIDAFVDGLALKIAGFARVVPKWTGRPGYAPRDLLKSPTRIFSGTLIIDKSVGYRTSWRCLTDRQNVLI